MTAPRFTCPRCGAALRTTVDGFVCSEDDESFPRLGPFVVLLPDADRALSRHRDAFLAALAERGEVPRGALAAIEAAHRTHRADPEPLYDDLTAREEGIADAPAPTGPAIDVLARLDQIAADEGPLAALRPHLGPSLGRVAEIGPGAGRLTRLLAEGADELVLLDRVPRTLVRLGQSIGRDGPAPTLAVATGDALPLAPARYDLVVAMNVVDLLEDPASFVERALEALAPGGRLLLTTPDPGLGSAEAGALEELIEALGGVIRVCVDGLPWLRHVSPRHRQVYLTQLIVAVRPE